MRSLSKISLVAAVFVFASCGESDPEQELMNSFFTAVQEGSEDGVKRVSLAPFDGNVVSWEIVESGEETEGPFGLKALEDQLEAKRDEIRAQRDSNADFLANNREMYDRYKNEYDPSKPFTGALLAFHEEWQAKQAQQQQLEADADQLSFDVRAMKDTAQMSVAGDVTSEFEGHITGKQLKLKVNDGSADKTYTFHLIRYDLTDPKSTIPPTARWIISEIQEGA